MNLLYCNDKRGQYPPSWYVATAQRTSIRQPLRENITADVCVIGAGFTGLSAALHLAETGRKVVVLEAQRVGFGASGRNGGLLISGQRILQTELEKRFDRHTSLRLWQLGEEAKRLVKTLISKHNIDCHLTPGLAWAARNARHFRILSVYAHHLQEKYTYKFLNVLSTEAMHELCPSPAYHGGLFDSDAGHLHPLKFALGLARAAERANAQIYELSAVTSVPKNSSTVITTEGYHVTADHVLFACNGYLGNLNHQIATHVMPINNFMIATCPLEQETKHVLTKNIAVHDTQFVVNYFRLSADKRLLFGGGESYGYRFPSNIASVVRKPLREIFPHLHNIRIDYAWGGTLAITMKRFPYILRLAPNIFSASGYSGHGIGTATHAGQLMALAIQGQSDGLDVMASIPSTPFPGGSRFRSPLLALALSWYALRDKLGI